MTSNALIRESTICIMSRALRACDDLDDASDRDACYATAGIGLEAVAEFDHLAIEREQLRRDRIEKVCSSISGAFTASVLGLLYVLLDAPDAMAATADIAGTMSWTAAGIIAGIFLIAIGLAAYVWLALYTVKDDDIIRDGQDRSDIERRARNAGAP